jgi:hypothetical protein
MTDPEINRKLWGAFLLGARVIADRNGKDLSYTEIDGLGRVAQEIAESDRTLEDPTAQAAKDREIGSLLQRLETLNIRSNRDLAKRIFEGFIIASDVTD